MTLFVFYGRPWTQSLDLVLVLTAICGWPVRCYAASTPSWPAATGSLRSPPSAHLHSKLPLPKVAYDASVPLEAWIHLGCGNGMIWRWNAGPESCGPGWGGFRTSVGEGEARARVTSTVLSYACPTHLLSCLWPTVHWQEPRKKGAGGSFTKKVWLGFIAAAGVALATVVTAVAH